MKAFTDRFSLLHLATGVVIYYWNVSLFNWFIIHALFEFIENTGYGMYFINNYFSMWPGGKTAPDSLLNSIGDQVYAMIGWLIADIYNKASGFTISSYY